MGVGELPTVEEGRGFQERGRKSSLDSKPAGRDMSSHQVAGCPVMFGLEILRQPEFPFSRILSQLKEVQGPSARHGALAEDRYGHQPQLHSPELQRTGR